MLRLAFDFIIAWREIRARPNAYELGLKLVTESNSNNYRLRRIIEINDSLKDVMQKFLVLRENSLVLDQSKSFYSDKDPHYSITCSDYYVFALRRILI